MTAVTLVSTLHDPGGHMAPHLAAQMAVLTQLYQQLVVVATPQSAASTLASLAHPAVAVQTDGDSRIGENRRRAVRRGLEACPTPYLHYCDLDRAVHWAMHQRRELEHVVDEVIPSADYTVLGRTAKAFASHPPVQQELEGMTNEVFSYIYGAEMDVTAGSCGLSRAAAHYLAQHSREPSNATDAEWPLLARRGGLRVAYTAVEGLSFETATFFGPRVHAAAHDADNWARRARLARDSINAALRIGGLNAG